MAREAPRLPARARRAGALLGRLRRDRLVDLLRARDRRRLRARAHAARPAAGAACFFLIVSLSYAEGTAAIPETGGAATFVRRAFNDLLGFLTGWALFLDYLIVIALSTLFLPHYLGTALGVDGLRESPWDVVVAVCVIVAITGVRLVRRPQLHAGGLAIAGLDLATQLLLVILGLALLFSPDLLTQGSSLGTRPPGTTSPSRCRSRCSPTPGSRRSRTSPRRPASRAGRCRAASSPRSALVVVADRADRRRRHLGLPGRERARRRSATSGWRRRSPASSTRSRTRCPAGWATPCASTSA